VSAAPLSVSCIVPVFNGAPHLAEAISSIRAQTYAPLEIIVVDDGSTDATREVAQSFGDGARYVWQTNAGPAAARNTGIAASTGDLIAFLDADDLWHPDKLSRQVERLRGQPTLDLCLTQVQNFWADELREEAKRLHEHFRAQPLAGYTSVALVARRQVFDRIGCYDTNLKHGADADWFARVEEAGLAIGMLDEVLVYRRLHSQNRSRVWSDRSQEEILRVMKSIVDRRRGKSA
jgi:glycosyltransferase involved in cell wall biosynthesis